MFDISVLQDSLYVFVRFYFRVADVAWRAYTQGYAIAHASLTKNFFALCAHACVSKRKEST